MTKADHTALSGTEHHQGSSRGHGDATSTKARKKAQKRRLHKMITAAPNK